MNIGIDARLYGSQHAGLGRYSENLIKQLEQIDSQNQYFIFLAADAFAAYQPTKSNFHKVLADFRPYGWQEQLLLPLLLKKYRLDLVHFLHFNVPLFYFGEFVVTIHDLIISHYPDSRATTRHPLVYRLKLWLYRLVVARAARRAKKIIAVSQYTKTDIVKLLGAPAKKIIVTYEGVDLPTESKINCRQLLAQKKLGGDFLLYVGSAYPHKNLSRLLAAFKELTAKRPDLLLVLVGKESYFYRRLYREIAELKLTGRVVLTGYLSDQELTCLYQAAKLYVFPSLLEGFGLPPLEAQGYGLPVASSNASCLPEILGESAVYFAPENIAEMAEVIGNALAAEKVLADLRRRGLENAKKYSWRQCAEETITAYNS